MAIEAVQAQAYAIVKYSMSAIRPDAEPIMTICELPPTIRFVTNGI